MIHAITAPTRRYGVLYIGPSIGEAVAVCVLFYVHFKLWSLSLLVFGAVGAYAILTVKMTLWRKRFRSAMNKSDNAWHDRLTDSLVNFETVKYFTAEAELGVLYLKGLGVCGGFTPSTRVVSRREGGGWSLFRF